MKDKMDDFAENAQQWLTSDAGLEQLSNAVEQARQMSDGLDKARELKPEFLYDPITL